MLKIMVVEDDVSLNRSVCDFLGMNGFDTIACHNATQAYDALYEQPFDLIISDVMMPGVDGFELAANIRAIDAEIPILFMTALDDMPSMQRGYRIGIDDYMTKPVNLDELLLRIGALLRRSRISTSHRLEIGDFAMDLDERSATLAGTEIDLTLREFNILYKLLSYPKKAFTRQQLMDEFWEIGTTSGTRTVDVYMTKLRAKLADCHDFEIKTVRGLGYKATINE